MTVTGTDFGHPTVYNQVLGKWFYQDTGEEVNSKISRPCTKCGEVRTPEGYDPCMGYVRGATAVCCGYGVRCGVIVYPDRVYRGPIDGVGDKQDETVQ